MQLRAEDEMILMIDECLSELEDIEAALIRECHLQEPRTALPAFAKQRNLSQKALTDLRSRALDQLKEALAKKNIRSLGDIL
jgi:hypothetical protein